MKFKSSQEHQLKKSYIQGSQLQIAQIPNCQTSNSDLDSSNADDIMLSNKNNLKLSSKIKKVIILVNLILLLLLLYHSLFAVDDKTGVLALSQLRLKAQKHLQKSLNKQYSYDCKQLQTIFHYFKDLEALLYYRSPYKLFFPYCQIGTGVKEIFIGRLEVESWSKERQMIEWARKYVKRGENILYDCTNCYNMLRIIILAKFVGKNGSVILLNSDKNNCLLKTLKLHKISNVMFVSRSQGIYRKYKTVISFNQKFFAKEINSGLFTQMHHQIPQKILIKLQAKKEQIKSILAVNNTNIVVNKVSLNNSDCNSVIKTHKVDNEPGYYQLISDQYYAKLEQKSLLVEQQSHIQGPLLKELSKQYQKFKQKLPSPQQKKDITKIAEKFPIISNKLKGIPRKKLQKWQSEPQVIQWVKNRTQSNSVIFLQQKNRYNLLTILNTAALIPQGKLFLRVSSQKWLSIRKYAERLKIKNIVRTDNTKLSILQAHYLILDDLGTIKTFFNETNIQQMIILAYFDEKTASRDQIYRLYVNHYIRRVRIKPSYYFGYQIFDSFFFSSENPVGFFEIQKKTYTIYQFWGQTLKELTPNRRFAIQQIIKVNTPQVKVINSVLLPYFILPEQPLHKAFYYLTPVHKSDYLRGYFMHHYGGGYSDIKHLHHDYLPYFKKLDKSPEDIYAIGYRQRSALHIACIQETGELVCSLLRKNYLKMIGNGKYIFKKRTPLSAQWVRRARQKLDLHYEHLKINRYTYIREHKGSRSIVNGKQTVSKYPLRWAQLAGELLARAQLSNLGHYYTDLPYVIPVNYR